MFLFKCCSTNPSHLDSQTSDNSMYVDQQRTIKVETPITMYNSDSKNEDFGKSKKIQNSIVIDGIRQNENQT